jgi:hypothetical protein
MTSKIVISLCLAAWCLFGVLFLSGCETLRFGVQTDFGTFSYELPTRTLKDK